MPKPNPLECVRTALGSLCRDPILRNRQRVLKAVRMPESASYMNEILSELLDERYLGSEQCHYVRSTCMLALGLSGSPRAVEPLKQVMTSEHDWWVKAPAVEALCSLVPDWMSSALLKDTRSGKWRVRKAATEGLSHLKRDDVQERLREMMKGDRLISVRRAAALALAKQGVDDLLDVCKEFTGIVRELTQYFARRNDSQSLIKLRSHPSAHVRYGFIDGLMWMRNARKSGRPHLRILLADSNLEVRLSAACNLAKYEPDLVQEFAIRLLREDADEALVRLVRAYLPFAEVPAIQAFLWNLSSKSTSRCSGSAKRLLNKAYGLPHNIA